MADRITPQDFERLAELASLELTREEAEYLRRELNNQMISIEVLESIPIEADVSAAPHGVPYDSSNSPSPRADETHPDPSRQEILGQAPELEDGYIVVPDISHQELE